MKKFEIGSFVKLIANGRIGKVTESEKNKTEVLFQGQDEMTDLGTFDNSELKEIDVPDIRNSDLKLYVRGEKSLSEITHGLGFITHIEKVPEGEAYHVTAEDLLCGIRCYKEKTPLEAEEWLSTILEFDKELHFPFCQNVKIRNKVEEEHVLQFAYDALIDVRYTVCGDMTPDDLDEAENILKVWIDSDGTDYADVIKWYIADTYDEDDIDKQPEVTQELFKTCLDYCCDVMKEPKAIQKRGYCYYCGTKVYPNDWEKARDTFLEYYTMTGDGSAANTLGYIYYYGRCNDGIPEYDLAFKYFAIGHVNHYFESTYKLADMFANGYGVVKDPAVAEQLYRDVYTENLELLASGEYNCKFADAALRMGNCYLNGLGVIPEPKLAYTYYLQADFAIKKRIKSTNYFGDTQVQKNIQEALEKARNEYPEKKSTVSSYYPFWASWASGIEKKKCRLVVEKGKDGAFTIKTSLVKNMDEYKVPKILITVPEADYCDLKKKIKVTTAANSNVSLPKGKTEIIFNDFVFDHHAKATTFYLNGEYAGKITTSSYTFVPKKKVKVASGRVHHFVSVCFGRGGRYYDYLCDDLSIEVGDDVIVDSITGEKVVSVESVFDADESDLELPFSRYKYIVGKA